MNRGCVLRTCCSEGMDQCSSVRPPNKKTGSVQASLPEPVFYCAAFILQVHFGPSDKVGLGIFEHFHEVCGEAGYTDYKVLVVFRMLLRIL